MKIQTFSVHTMIICMQKNSAVCKNTHTLQMNTNSSNYHYEVTARAVDPAARLDEPFNVLISFDRIDSNDVSHLQHSTFSAY